MGKRKTFLGRIQNGNAAGFLGRGINKRRDFGPLPLDPLKVVNNEFLDVFYIINSFVVQFGFEHEEVLSPVVLIPDEQNSFLQHPLIQLRVIQV